MFAKFAATSATARRLSVAGVVATALFGLSACATQSTAQNTAAVKPAASGAAAAQISPAASASIAYQAGLSVISNGTATVLVGGKSVTFPTSVTGAAWSPDGSRLAFVDGGGDIATAHPDGSSLTVLTTAKTGVTRSNPTWIGNLIVFTEKDAKGVSRMETVTAAGPATQPELLMLSGNTDGDGNSIDTANSEADAIPARPGQLDNDGQVAYVHEGSDGPEVWIVDLNAREVGGRKVANGTDPAVSPDGSEIAYVTSKGQIDVMPDFVYSTQSTQTATQVTFSAAAPTNLTWSPDGTRIDFSTAAGIESVSADVPAHATSNAVMQLSSTPGAISFLPGTKNEIDQFTGTDPVALSIAASQDRFPTETTYAPSQDADPAMFATIGSSTALTTDLNLLSPGTLGPMLLTNGSSLDPRVTAELQRIFGPVPAGEQGPTVYLLGGTGDISTSVENALQKLGYQTQRVTSPPAPLGAKGAGYLYAQIGPSQVRTIVIDSASPLDELIGTAYANYYQAPVVQVNGGVLSAGNLTSLSQGSGPARPTALFGPASAFGGQFVTAVATQEDAPLGYTTVVNPAQPMK